MRLIAGPWYAATLYPGGRVEGVSVREGVTDLVVEVHIVIGDPRAWAIAERVRAAVELELLRLAQLATVLIVVEDLEIAEGSIVVGSEA